MFGLGFSEILVLGAIALIFLGPEQLPELARTLGRFINELKRSTESITEDLKSQVELDLREKRKEIYLSTPETAQEKPQNTPPESSDLSRGSRLGDEGDENEVKR